MSFISSLELVGNGTTMQQCGSEKVPFNCPKALQAYNEYKGCDDFEKEVGGSFTEKSCFKKWYKKVYLGIINFMRVNSLNAWNMSATLKGAFRTTLNDKENVCC